jgi:tight adherence protein C
VKEGRVFETISTPAILIFVGTASLVFLVPLLIGRRSDRTSERVRTLAAEPEPEPQPRAAAGLSPLTRFLAALHPGSAQGQDQLQKRLILAGLYNRHAPAAFLGLRFLLLLGGALLVLAAFLLRWLSTTRAAYVGCLVIMVGMLAPGLWLDARKRARQRELRRGLPDLLGMLVLCMQGGLSLTGALQRVIAELRLGHPQLAAEMNIVQREMFLGLSVGEALRKFGSRCDLEEVRNLASVLTQAEHYGSSMSKTLRIHADAYREQLQRRIEEMAQKASVKILFPTLLCIFPAVFIVILGPAVYQLWEMFGKMN